jgi:hypothetical protein
MQRSVTSNTIRQALQLSASVTKFSTVLTSNNANVTGSNFGTLPE